MNDESRACQLSEVDGLSLPNNNCLEAGTNRQSNKGVLHWNIRSAKTRISKSRRGHPVNDCDKNCPRIQINAREINDRIRITIAHDPFTTTITMSTRQVHKS